MAWLPASQTVQDDYYIVVMVTGSIYNQTQGGLLKQGQKISSGDKLVFKGNARAIVMSATRGRFVIAPKTAGASEFNSTVFDALSPLKTNSKLSTRGFGEAEPILNFKDHFGDSAFTVIGDEYIFKINTSVYPLNTTNVPALSYKYDGKSVTKTISFKGNVASIKRSESFNIDNQVLSPETIRALDIRLLYISNVNDRATRKIDTLAKINLVFVAEAELKSQIETLMTIYQGENLSNSQLKEQLTAYVWDVYGHTDNHLLEDWLVANGFIQKEVK
ncbi:MAG: hypothetical protein HC913_16380 [Microscillaceae bacterium]|nr:hypothetical protein [Microscillaceae bacterium]